MKNFILFLIIFIPLISLAQSGVILPNGIDLPKVTTLATCSTAEKGRMVFRTTDNKAYYCNGTIWQEMTSGGFTLPYSATGNSNNVLLKIVNDSTGMSIWGESDDNYAIYGRSVTRPAIWGQSVESYGVSGYSADDAGVRGYGEIGVKGNTLTSTGYGIYGSGLNGRAGYFEGNVIISDELKVSENKGIIQNTNSTQLKYFTGKIYFPNRTLNAFTSYTSDVIPIPTYSAKPVVYIGDIEDQTGDYFKVTISVVSVDTNSFRVRLYNASDATINFGATWNIVAIGAK